MFPLKLSKSLQKQFLSLSKGTFYSNLPPNFRFPSPPLALRPDQRIQRAIKQEAERHAHPRGEAQLLRDKRPPRQLWRPCGPQGEHRQLVRREQVFLPFFSHFSLSFPLLSPSVQESTTSTRPICAGPRSMSSQRSTTEVC